VSPKIVHLVAAARPNFMKVAPLYHRLAREGWCAARIVHTGQHYDANMSDAFFRDLGLPEPAHHLEVGSGSHAEQTGRTMIAYEAVCQGPRGRRPELWDGGTPQRAAASLRRLLSLATR
jgi:UDP-N-acetylglucosamine 2-epimerase (non-hydrolysing)